MSTIVKILIYQWAGNLGPFRITSECSECHLAVAQARGLLSSHPDWPVELEVKPWLNHAWESLRQGGWHAPVVVVEGRLIRQGQVPSRAELEQEVREALARSGFQPERELIRERASPA